MSKIQVLIDMGEVELSGSELSPEGILKAVSEIDSTRKENDRLKKENSILKGDIVSLGEAIEKVLDGDYGLMNKFRDLRQIAREAKAFGK